MKGKKERVKHFIERFENIDPFNPVPKFHFGSHYSNPGIILFYLIRLFPFTKGAIELQNGSFDLPDRLFYSIEETFKNSMEDNSDVRELIPELFYQPESLININNENFGIQQNGVR